MLRSEFFSQEREIVPHKQIIRLPKRSLSSVLMRATLIVALALGIAAGLIQIAIDISQEKEVVEINASELIASVVPAAEEAI